MITLYACIAILIYKAIVQALISVEELVSVVDAPLLKVCSAPGEMISIIVIFWFLAAGV